MSAIEIPTPPEGPPAPRGCPTTRAVVIAGLEAKCRRLRDLAGREAAYGATPEGIATELRATERALATTRAAP